MKIQFVLELWSHFQQYPVFLNLFLSLLRSKLENDKSSNNFSLLVYSKNFYILMSITSLFEKEQAKII